MGSPSPSPSSSMELVEYGRIPPPPRQEEDIDDVNAVLNLLNYKVVPRKPGDPGYAPATFMPSEARLYATEFVKMHGEIEGLQKQLEEKAAEQQDQLSKSKDKMEEIQKHMEERVSKEKEIVETFKKKISEQQQQLKEEKKKNLELKNDLEQQRKEFSEQKSQLELAQSTIKSLQEIEAELKRKLDEDAVRHQNELEQIQNTVSEQNGRLLEYTNVLSELQKLMLTAKEKLAKQEIRLEIIQKEKSELEAKLEESENSKKECQVTLDNLQIQLERQVLKCSKLRTDLEDAQTTIDSKEQKLVEAEGIIIDQQKVVQEAEEQKKKLEKILQLNLKLDQKVLNLEGGIRERQLEIERLERCLNQERQENTNAQIKFRRLRDSVFSLNSEFAVFIEEVRTSQRIGTGDNDNDETSAQEKLELLSTHVKNKFIAWAKNQKFMQDELRKTQQVVIALSELLDQCQVVTVPPTTEEFLGQPINLNTRTTGGGFIDSTSIPVAAQNTASPSYRDIACHSSLSKVAGDNSTTNAKLPSNPVFNALNLTNWPSLLSSEEYKKAISSGGQGSILSTSTKRHGLDSTKRNLGWFCVCGDRKIGSRKDLTAHLKSICRKYQYKCFICHEQFLVLKHLKHHLWKKHNVVINAVKGRCIQCGKTFSSWNKLYEHKRTVHIIQKSKKILQRHGGSKSSKKKTNPPTPSIKTRRPPSPQKSSLRISFKKCQSPQSASSRWKILSSTISSRRSLKYDSQPISQTSSQERQLPISPPDSIINGNDNFIEQQQRLPVNLPGVDMETTAATENSIPKTTKSGQSETTTSTGQNIPETSTLITPTSPKDIIIQRQPLTRQMSSDNATQENVAVDAAEGGQVKKSHGVDLSKSFLGFYCICGQQLSTKHNLTMHIEYFTQEWKFHCEMCDQSFFCLYYLKRHYADAHKMPKHLKKFTVGCCECGTMFETRKEFNTHRKDVHQALPFQKNREKITETENTNPVEASSTPMSLSFIKQEPIDEDEVPADEVVVKHGIDRRSKDRRFGNFCKCGQKCSSKHALLSHIYYKNSPEKFFCPSCHRGFIGTSYLRRHMQSAHGMSYHLKGCRRCGSCFDTTKELRQHMSTEHKITRKKKIEEVDLTLNNKSDKEEAPTNKGTAKTSPEGEDNDDDEQEDNRSTEVVKHAKDTSRGKVGQCYCICGLKFVTNQTLRAHVINYTGEKKFECNICDKRFQFNGQLHKHLVGTHNVANLRSKGLFGCRDCGRLFKNLGVLFQHRKTTHSKKTRAKASSQNKPKPKSNGKTKSRTIMSPPPPQLSPIKSIPPPASSPPTLVSIKMEPVEDPLAQEDDHSLRPMHGVDWSRHKLGFFCNCGHQTSNKMILRQHIIYYSTPSQFSCRICGSMFKSTSRLRQHMLKVHDMNYDLKGCRQCGELFDTFIKLKEHQLTKHPQMRRKRKAEEVDLTKGHNEDDKPNNNTVEAKKTSKKNAPSSSKSVRSLPSIRKKHGVDLSKRHLGFFCVCGTKSNSALNLNTHINYFTSDRKFQCEMCDQRFLHLSRLKEHLVSAHKIHDIRQLDKMGMGCSECGRWGFLSHAALCQHRKQAHSSTAEPEQTITIPAPLPRLTRPPRENNHPQHPLKTNPPPPPRDITPAPTPRDITPAPPERDITPAPPEREINPPPSPRCSVPTAAEVLASQPSTTSSNVTSESEETLHFHGIDVKRSGNEYFCKCGTQFADSLSLRKHILKHINNYQSTAKNTPPPSQQQTPAVAYRQPARNASVIIPTPRVSITPVTGKVHKVIRLGNYPHLHMCECGDQFPSENSLQQHVRAMTVGASPITNIQMEGRSTVSPGPKPLAITLMRRSIESASQSDQAPPPPPPPARPSIIVQTGASSLNSVPPSAPPPSLSTLPGTNTLLPQQISPRSRSAGGKQEAQWKLNHGVDPTKSNRCLCGRQFKNKPNLSVHIQWYTGERKFVCNLCPMRFLGIGYLKKHLQVIHKKDLSQMELIGCRHCGDTFSSRSEFSKHRAAMHNSPKGKKGGRSNYVNTPSTSMAQGPSISVSLSGSNAVNQSISTPSNSSILQQQDNRFPPEYNSDNDDDEDMIIDAHLAFEDTEPVVDHGVDTTNAIWGHFCLCGQECSTKSTLNRHVRNYSSSRKFICKSCNHGFLGVGLLRNHMLRVHKISYTESNGCKECGETFPTNMELYHHFRMVHNRGSQWETREMKYVPPPSPTTTPISIPAPNYASQESSQEEPIKMFDENDGNFMNGYGFSGEEHEIVEQDPLSLDPTGYNFVCKCGCRYNTRNNLVQHIRQKKVGRIFQCYLCPMKFGTHGSLKTHVSNIHQVEYDRGKFACGICATTFDTLDEMKLHRREAHKRF